MNQFPRRFNILAAVVIAFSLIGGLPATGGAVARRNGNGLSTNQSHDLTSAAAAGCQWTYYPISGGQLQPEQSLLE